MYRYLRFDLRFLRLSKLGWNKHVLRFANFPLSWSHFPTFELWVVWLHAECKRYFSCAWCVCNWLAMQSWGFWVVVSVQLLSHKVFVRWDFWSVYWINIIVKSMIESFLSSLFELLLLHLINNASAVNKWLKLYEIDMRFVNKMCFQLSKPSTRIESNRTFYLMFSTRNIFRNRFVSDIWMNSKSH